jgi:ABC-2 type transport system ATP-binding protein
MPDHAALRVENVTKNYGNFRAVNNISFEVNRGEIFAILGPNGSGKTTTIRMILDILRPDSGTISVLGGPLTDATKDRLGYLPEERGLYRDAPVLEVMVYLGTLKGLSTSVAKERSLSLLNQLDLGEHAKSKVSGLSKGMQQKVQFAVTILHQPELIIVDEPFSGLDPVNTLAIKQMLHDFKAQGGAIIMSTHQMQQVEEMSDRLLMISKGERKLYGPLADVRREFSAHALVVEGQGDWASLPGVKSVSGNGNQGFTLQLEDNVEPEQVLSAIVNNNSAFRLDRFEKAIPSLNEIFIEVERRR